MKRNINEIFFDRQYVLKLLADTDFEKYSIKPLDYKDERFADNEKVVGFNPILSVVKPEFIAEIAERFFRVGCDFIVAETGKLNRFYLKDLGLDDISYELNFNYIKILSEKANKYSNITQKKQRFIGGQIFDFDIDDKELTKSYYKEQLKGLYAGKVDFVYLDNFKSIENTVLVLELLGDLMQRRNKSTAFMIANYSDEYLDEVSQFLESKNFERLKFLGFVKILETDELNKHGQDGVLISLSEEREIKLENLDYKILGFYRNVSPEMIENLLK